MKELSECPVCGLGSGRASVRHVRERDRLVVCPRCGLLYADAHPEPDELAELYRARYYDEATALSGRRRWGAAPERLIFEMLWPALARRFPRLREGGARVLDYGCGVGQFLAVARDRGAACVGIEVSDEAARYVRERLGIRILTGGESELARLPGDSFDLVLMHGVLEHLRDPLLAAALARDKLRRGGAFAVFVPNAGALVHVLRGRDNVRARTSRRGRDNGSVRTSRRGRDNGSVRTSRRGRARGDLAKPTHLAVYSRRAVRILLGRAGYRDVRRLVFWGGRRGFGPVLNLAQLVARIAGLGSGHYFTAVK